MQQRNVRKRGGDIADGEIDTADIVDEAVKPSKIGDDVQRNQHVGTVETAITGGLATVDYCIAQPRAEADLAQTSPPSGGTVFRAYPDAAGAGSADFILFGS